MAAAVVRRFQQATAEAEMESAAKPEAEAASEAATRALQMRPPVPWRVISGFTAFLSGDEQRAEYLRLAREAFPVLHGAAAAARARAGPESKGT